MEIGLAFSSARTWSSMILRGVTTAVAAAARTFGVAVFYGAFVFGAFLALLTLFGLEETQAFTALDHPGFKHFLRLRVRRDGSAVDFWCLGLTDPLSSIASDTESLRSMRELLRAYSPERLKYSEMDIILEPVMAWLEMNSSMPIR